MLCDRDARCAGRLHLDERFEILTRREAATRAADRNRAHALIGGPAFECGQELDRHGVVKGVDLFGPIQCEGQDGAFLRSEDDGFAHAPPLRARRAQMLFVSRPTSARTRRPLYSVLCKHR